MWFPLALASAVLYAAMWLFARGSRGMPPSVVTAFMLIWAVPLLALTAGTVNFPWGDWWWQAYLILPFAIMPATLLALTTASQRSDVSVIKPLAALSTLATLLFSAAVFGRSFLPIHILGITFITGGLFLLYRNRWYAWRRPWPWVVLACVLVLGINVAVLKEILDLFPHPIALLALDNSAIFVVTALIAGKKWKAITIHPRSLLLLGSFAIVTLAQEITTFTAISLGPAPHVIAVKRTSILFATIGGYIIFKERDQSLVRLLISCVIVVVGVTMLNA